MSADRTQAQDARCKVLLATRDPALAASTASAFANDPRIELLTVEDGVDVAEPKIRAETLSALIVDFDPGRSEETAALERLAKRLDRQTPIIAIPASFDQGLARWFLKVRVGDFLIRPVATADLVRTVTRAISDLGDDAPTQSQIYAFMPASGGVGVTTLAIATAFILSGDAKREQPSTCLVDLNFQYGAVADYLDVEPRLNLSEIEAAPERLDRQLLEVMISRHKSGIAVIAAPNAPAEMRSFDAEVVTRLLDLVSAYFDVVILDMPRTWFQWTENVMIGSDKLFIVSEMTVPDLRQAQRLLKAIDERLPEQVDPQVIINRFEQSMFDSGVRRGDLERALGKALSGTVPNNYRLVREAIDRGVPLDEVRAGNDVSASLSRIIGATGGASDATAKSGLIGLGRKLMARG